MKKNTLSTALLAGLVGTVGMVGISNAVNINPDGIGQALIYPYYTVRDGQLSLMSVVNTSEAARAVKVRYIEGKASLEVLDFNLYMSPFDVWTAAIVDNGSGASIVVADRSCTVPDIVRDHGGVVNFRNTLFIGDATGDTSLDRTREGYVEVIEMAVLTSTAAAFVTHTPGGTDPLNCAALVSDWIDGVFSIPGTGPVADGGALFGGMSIIDPAVGSDAAYNALALQAFNTTSTGLHTGPGSTSPSLASAAPMSIVFNSGTVVTSDWSTLGGTANPLGGADAVSATIMHDAIMNEWNSETTGGITAYTDWVITFPTKRFYVDAYAVFGTANPFTSEMTPVGACEEIAISYWDREEDEPVGDVDFSPVPPGGTNVLCWETSLITFDGANALSSNLAANIETSGVLGDNGWAKIMFTDPTNFIEDAAGVIYFGLPTTGFMVQEFVDADPASTANYTGLFPHRGTRSIL